MMSPFLRGEEGSKIKEKWWRMFVNGGKLGKNLRKTSNVIYGWPQYVKYIGYRIANYDVPSRIEYFA